MPEPYTTVSSRLIPLPAENVDTDQIIPARFLKTTEKSGLAEALFNDWRRNEDGSLKDPPFILDKPAMQGRQVLLVGDNFGAGSSREHAPWALTSWGIRAVISTSFADIFRNNSLKNGLLPIVVDPDTHRRLWDMIEADPDAGVTIDLAEQGMLLPDGSTYEFEIDPFAREMLLAGTDEIGWVLQRSHTIDAWEAAHPARIDTRPIADTTPLPAVAAGAGAPSAS
jgi:3-isopropylmalate/(R)-2-methylmalate dehydratase small subunit